MKIVLSRKGFDSSYGGVPSPIFDDGSMLSFPIPSRSGRPVGDLQHRGLGVAPVMQALTGARFNSTTTVHLDPDLEASTVERIPGWRPTFGQVAAAQRHLTNQRVGPGDLFLFFGWFRRVRASAGSWAYARSDAGTHTLFGWLQVEEVLAVGDASKLLMTRPWLAHHPHVVFASTVGASNTIYVAAEKVTMNGRRLAVPGAGVFPKWSSNLQLTAPGFTRSVWDLPGWMMPGRGLSAPLTYHGRLSRWQAIGDRVRLESVAKGQEFVQDVGTNQHALAWVQQLLENHAGEASMEPRVGRT
jgi:hypothetical protein